MRTSFRQWRQKHGALSLHVRLHTNVGVITRASATGWRQEDGTREGTHAAADSWRTCVACVRQERWIPPSVRTWCCGGGVRARGVVFLLKKTREQAMEITILPVKAFCLRARPKLFSELKATPPVPGSPRPRPTPPSARPSFTDVFLLYSYTLYIILSYRFVVSAK